MSRPPRAADPLHIRFAEFELDEANASLRRDGAPVALAPTPFDLLCALARQPGALLAKDQLLDAVWGHRFVTESVLKTAVSDLRSALGDSARAPRIVETVPRRGYRFVARPTALAPPPAPAAAAPRVIEPPSSFIGRADALSRLQRAWGDAHAGRRRVVWVAGEPGIGKTTLIEHFAAGVGDALCARGQCVEHHGSGEPYLPVLDALAELSRRDPTLPALLRQVAPTWLLQLPWLVGADERDMLRRERAGVGAERMLREMGELLDRYTEQRPLLLVTEDLHWSDRATLQLIDHVARRRGPARLMWLASFRVAEVVALDHPMNSLRRELRLQRLCEEVVLDPFSEAEVAAYVRRHAAALPGDEGFVRALHERTDGVPLFLSSVVAELTEPGSDAAPLDQRLAAAVPENVTAIIDHQIARLGDGQRVLLAAAAVCGVEFRVGTVAAALDRELAAVALACDELVRGQVWLSAPRGGDGDPLAPHAFRHALFRQVLYERIPAAVKPQLHSAVGRALERERAAGVAVPASELALHFERAREPMAALRHYADAARAALAAFSPTTCIALTERALALLPKAADGPPRDELEITLATLHGVAAFHALGVGHEARDAFERADTVLARVPVHPLCGVLLHGSGYVLSLRGEYARALEVARRAEALCAGGDEVDGMLPLAASFLQAHVGHMQGRGAQVRVWMQRGIEIAETLERRADAGLAADPHVALLGMLAVDLVRSGSVGQARDHVQRAQARALALRQPMSRLVAAWHEALVELRLGDVERMRAIVPRMEQLVDEFSLEQGRTACEWFRGWVEAHDGRPREGHARIRAAQEANLRLGMRAGSSEVLGYAVQALLLAGDARRARAELDEALRVVAELGEGVYLPQLRLLDAAVANACGDRAAGAAAARHAVEQARAQDAPWVELQALVHLCEHGDAAAAERDALASLIDRLPEAAGLEAVQRARSLLPAQG